MNMASPLHDPIQQGASRDDDKAEVFEVSNPIASEDIIEQGNAAILLDIGAAGKAGLAGAHLKLSKDGHVCI